MDEQDDQYDLYNGVKFGKARTFSAREVEQLQQQGVQQQRASKRRRARSPTLGAGAYGVVRRAERGDATVAVKRCAFESAAVLDEYSAAQGGRHTVPPSLLKEAAVLQELQHDNIVALLDVIANDSSIEFVFELMDMDMKAYLEQLGRVRMHDMFVWEFSRQMFSGLEFLHRNGVVHRDLKPHNLLLSNKQGRGRFPRLKIADFGLSRFVTEPISSYSSEMVTLWYRAPEILLQARTYGTEIDIWSAGCIICEFASGVPLLPGADAAAELELMVAVLGPPPLAAVQLMKAHAAGHMLDEISEIVEDTPLDELVSLSRPGGLKLVKWCLEYLPGDRCSAMQALSHTVFSHKQ